MEHNLNFIQLIKSELLVANEKFNQLKDGIFISNENIAKSNDFEHKFFQTHQEPYILQIVNFEKN